MLHKFSCRFAREAGEYRNRSDDAEFDRFAAADGSDRMDILYRAIRYSQYTDSFGEVACAGRESPGVAWLAVQRVKRPVVGAIDAVLPDVETACRASRTVHGSARVE
jgi:hypothetical protein